MANITTSLITEQAVCYLRLNKDSLKMWNFIAEEQVLFNTDLLFRAAAKPHFDYFFKHVDFFGLEDFNEPNFINNQEFKTQLLEKKAGFLPSASTAEEIAAFLKNFKGKIVLITKKGYMPKTALPMSHRVLVDNIEPFGNTEPVWRDIRKQLPASADLYILSLGIEKFLIGPRLKLMFDKPVLDISPDQGPVAAPRFSQFKSFVKKLAQ